MGIATVSFSIFVAISFFRGRRRLVSASARYLSDAMWLQLAGEAVMGFVTIVFALGAHFGWLDSWSSELQSLMRFIMFSATSLTTWHLYRVVKTIISEGK